MNAATVARMIEVLKATWVYKLKSKEDRQAEADFSASSIKDVIYEEDHGFPTILVILKDGTRRVGHPAEMTMTELEALTSWAENHKSNPR